MCVWTSLSPTECTLEPLSVVWCHAAHPPQRVQKEWVRECVDFAACFRRTQLSRAIAVSSNASDGTAALNIIIIIIIYNEALLLILHIFHPTQLNTHARIASNSSSRSVIKCSATHAERLFWYSVWLGSNCTSECARILWERRGRDQTTAGSEAAKFYVCGLSKVHRANLLLVYVKRIERAHATASERRSEIVFGYCQFVHWLSRTGPFVSQ